MHVTSLIFNTALDLTYSHPTYYYVADDRNTKVCGEVAEIARERREQTANIHLKYMKNKWVHASVSYLAHAGRNKMVGRS